MLKIECITVGALKERYWQDAVKEYQKRLRRFCQLQITELKEVKIIDENSKEFVEAALKKEAQQILKRIKANDYVVALAIDGDMLNSAQLAKTVANWERVGQKIIVIIGSSHGLDEKIYHRAQQQISFSSLTFPHQLMRVLLLEQVYRSYKINANEAYHK